jgi:recombination protein RecA
MGTEEKRQLLNAAIKTLEKTYGKGIAFWTTDAPLDVDAIPTGSLAVDMCIGCGGIPRGRITELVGPQGSGKSTLIQHVIAEAQKMGELCALIDVENSFDKKWAITCGVNVDDLLISQPQCGEEAMDIAEGLVRSEAVAVVAVDSVAALLPRSEMEGSMDDMQVGALARLVSKAMRKLGPPVHKSNTALILSNQIRERIGGFSPHGTPETTPGGRALRHMASLRIDLRSGDFIKDGKETIGMTSKVRVKKNRFGPPLKECTFDIIFGQGIDKAGGLLDVAIEMDVVSKAGPWLKWNGFQWQGKEQAKLYLRQNEDVVADLEKQVREKM